MVKDQLVLYNLANNFDILRVVLGEKLIYFWCFGVKKKVYLGILYCQRPEKVENTGIFDSSKQVIF